MSLNGSSGEEVFRSTRGSDSSWDTKVFVVVEEHNVEIAFSLYQTLKKVFHSVDSVEKLEAPCLATLRQCTY